LSTGGFVNTGANSYSAVASNAAGQGIVNLLGGTLTTNAISSPAGTSTSTGINQINLNGGTLKYSGAVANANFLAAIPAGAAGASGVFVRSGGAFIDTNGQNVTIAAALLAPTGGEISSISVSGASAPGTFLTAPYVRITGGNNDATAVARVNADGSLHSIIVTNPGSGYSVNPPTVTLVGGTNSGGASTVTGTALAGVVDSTSGSLTKTGANSLILSGANTYTGGTVISSGNIEATVSSAFGTGAVDVLTDSRLIVNGNNVTIANDITLEGSSAAGAIYSGDRPAGNVTNFTGKITLEADSNISSWWNDKTLRLSGKITGTGGLNFICQTNSVGGRFFITGLENDYLGATTVTGDIAPRGGYTGQAMLYLGAENALPVTSALTLNNADLYLNGQSQTLPSITGAGSFAVRNGSTTPAILTLGEGDVSSTFAGSIQDNGIAVTNTAAAAPTVTGTVSFKKTGTGTLTLAGINTYSGDTEVVAGTLALADNAQLKFVLGIDTGLNNRIFGAGTASLDGDFLIDTTAADTLPSGSWLLENVASLTGAYGPNFTVVGFTDAGDNKWTKTVGSKKYTFDETTGTLTMITSGYTLWAGVNSAGANLNDDHDGDGVANGVEYFLGGPSGNTTGFTALPGVTNTAGTLSVTWAMGAGYAGVYGTDFTVETSDTLTGTWTTESSPGTVSISGSNVTYTFPAPLGTKKFARLKVTGP
jgi:autotransporter-associated beta strand protein